MDPSREYKSFRIRNTGTGTGSPFQSFTWQWHVRPCPWSPVVLQPLLLLLSQCYRQQEHFLLATTGMRSQFWLVVGTGYLQERSNLKKFADLSTKDTDHKRKSLICIILELHGSAALLLVPTRFVFGYFLCLKLNDLQIICKQVFNSVIFDVLMNSGPKEVPNRKSRIRILLENYKHLKPCCYKVTWTFSLSSISSSKVWSSLGQIAPQVRQHDTTELYAKLCIRL